MGICSLTPPQVIHKQFVYVSTQHKSFIPVDIRERIQEHKEKATQVPIYLIYSHDQTDELDEIEEFLDAVVRFLPVHLVSYEYSGRASSHGPHNFLTAQHSLNDLQAVIQYLMTHRQAQTSQMVLYARGVGVKVCLEMARRHDFKGLILEHLPFPESIPESMHQPSDQPLVDCISKIKELKCPLLFLEPNEKTQLLIKSIQQLRGETLCVLCLWEGKDILVAKPVEFQKVFQQLFKCV